MRWIGWGWRRCPAGRIGRRRKGGSCFEAATRGGNAELGRFGNPISSWAMPWLVVSWSPWRRSMKHRRNALPATTAEHPTNVPPHPRARSSTARPLRPCFTGAATPTSPRRSPRSRAKLPSLQTFPASLLRFPWFDSLAPRRRRSFTSPHLLRLPLRHPPLSDFPRSFERQVSNLLCFQNQTAPSTNRMDRSRPGGIIYPGASRSG